MILLFVVFWVFGCLVCFGLGVFGYGLYLVGVCWLGVSCVLAVGFLWFVGFELLGLIFGVFKP